MDILSNTTKVHELEHEALNSIELAIWIIAGLAICTFLMCVYRFIDSIIGAISCFCRCLTCCCRSNDYKSLNK